MKTELDQDRLKDIAEKLNSSIKGIFALSIF